MQERTYIENIVIAGTNLISLADAVEQNKDKMQENFASYFNILKKERKTDAKQRTFLLESLP